MVQSKKLLIVLVILVISLAPRFLLTRVRTVSDRRPVEFLPERAGPWEAVDVLICPRCLQEQEDAVWYRKTPSSPNIQLAYFEDQVEDETCPVHKVPLTRTKDVPVDFMTRKVLPPGTEFLRRWYRSTDPDTASDISTTIITSGTDKRSIHRPERCLQGQGWQLVARDRWTVPSPSGTSGNLVVTRLVVRSVGLTPDGKKSETKNVVFYWFMGHNRLTGSNLKRMAYTAWDRMVRGVNYRWSYALLRAPVRGSVRETSQALSRFVSELLPSILRSQPPDPQSRRAETQPRHAGTMGILPMDFHGSR
jgi:EpsI family protein